MTNATDVTGAENGLAVPAVQMNAAVDGTIANTVQKVNESLLKTEVWTTYAYVDKTLYTVGSIDVLFREININSFDRFSESKWNRKKFVTLNAFNSNHNNNICVQMAIRDDSIITINTLYVGNYCVQVTVGF